jgi:hypothetical protein
VRTQSFVSYRASAEPPETGGSFTTAQPQVEVTEALDRELVPLICVNFLLLINSPRATIVRAACALGERLNTCVTDPLFPSWPGSF